jgi:hypothetical protein
MDATCAALRAVLLLVLLQLKGIAMCMDIKERQGQQGFCKMDADATIIAPSFSWI